MNPFSPTFGASPPLLAGRDAVLEDFAKAIETGPGHPNYTTLYLGARGVGKTVVLNAVEDLARSHGWLTVSESASPEGMLARICAAAQRLLADRRGPAPSRRVKGVRGPGGAGVDFELDPPDARPEDLRTVLTELGLRLADDSTGLLITIDELHDAPLDRVREFGSVLQHVTRREGLPVAFAAAGLPLIEDTLLTGDAATFLQRCARCDIDFLDGDAAASALQRPIEEAGGSITADALDSAVGAASGYPFMVQLVGFLSWEAAKVQAPAITAEHVAVGVVAAEARLNRQVLEPIWRDLSDVDRIFLLAMSDDDGESHTSAIGERMGVGPQYVGVYRQRLIAAGMVTPSGHGRLRFTHHTALDWLRAKGAAASEQEPS